MSGKNDREKIASALKKLIKDASFSTGGVIKDLVKLSGEDGISFLQRGEAVLSKEQTQAFLNFKPVIPQIDSIIGNLKNIPIEKVSSQSPTYQHFVSIFMVLHDILSLLIRVSLKLRTLLKQH